SEMRNLQTYGRFKSSRNASNPSLWTFLDFLRSAHKGDHINPGNAPWFNAGGRVIRRRWMKETHSPSHALGDRNRVRRRRGLRSTSARRWGACRCRRTYSTIRLSNSESGAEMAQRDNLWFGLKTETPVEVVDN